MQIGEFAFKFDQGMAGAGNVAGAARAGSHARCSLHHRTDHLGMLRHRKVIIRAPHGYFPLPIRRMPNSAGETSNHSLEISEYPITPLSMKPVQSSRKEILIVHMRICLYAAARGRMRSIVLGTLPNPRADAAAVAAR